VESLDVRGIELDHEVDVVSEPRLAVQDRGDRIGRRVLDVEFVEGFYKAARRSGDNTEEDVPDTPLDLLLEVRFAKTDSGRSQLPRCLAFVWPPRPGARCREASGRAFLARGNGLVAGGNANRLSGWWPLGRTRHDPGLVRLERGLGPMVREREYVAPGQEHHGPGQVNVGLGQVSIGPGQGFIGPGQVSGGRELVRDGPGAWLYV
jgi:hypothetical protein